MTIKKLLLAFRVVFCAVLPIFSPFLEISLFFWCFKYHIISFIAGIWGFVRWIAELLFERLCEKPLSVAHKIMGLQKLWSKFMTLWVGLRETGRDFYVAWILVIIVAINLFQFNLQSTIYKYSQITFGYFVVDINYFRWFKNTFAVHQDPCNINFSYVSRAINPHSIKFNDSIS